MLLVAVAVPVFVAVNRIGEGTAVGVPVVVWQSAVRVGSTNVGRLGVMVAGGFVAAVGRTQSERRSCRVTAAESGDAAELNPQCRH